MNAVSILICVSLCGYIFLGVVYSINFLSEHKGDFMAYYAKKLLKVNA